MNLKLKDQSRGVLLFAFNTDIDYVKIADLNAKCITKFLNLPITLVTDLDSITDFKYDKIIRINQSRSNSRILKGKGTVEWKNVDRYLAYELSPYDHTLVLDVDYFIFNDSLLKLFELDHDYRLSYNMISIKGDTEFNYMNSSSLPQVWATAFIFQKTLKSKTFFQLIERIQLNYDYYRTLFEIRDTNFRNDFAFSIANIIVNGYCIDNTYNIPWPIVNIDESINSMDTNNRFLIVKTSQSAFVCPKHNMHVMSKDYLSTENFQNFIGKILNG